MRKIAFGKGPIHSSPPSTTDATQPVMMVRVLWNGIIQKAEEIPLERNGTATFTIGEDPISDFLVPSAHIGGRERFELATVTGEGLTVSCLSGMSFKVLGPNRTSQKPRQIDIERYSIAPKETGVVSLGPWTIEFRMETRSLFDRGPVTFDARTGYFLGFSFLVHTVFLFIFFLVPPDAAGFSFDENRESSRFVKAVLGVQEAVHQIEPVAPLPEKRPEAAGGKAHADVSGEMGDRQAPKTTKRSGISGRPDNLTPHMKKEDLKTMAESGGIFALLSARKMPTSPFGLDTASGFDPEDALGALTGDEIGANLGYGGLALRGTGRGGGGDGRNTIGVGSLGRIAWTRLRGRCTGAHCDFFGSASRNFSKRRGSGVRVRSTDVAVKGALSKETIRRIVRRHLNEIKFCYEKGLRKRPDLSGRVSVRFLIEPTGGVKTAAVASSTTNDFSVDQCIAHTVSRMTFPMPKESGIVIVTYPFTLTSSDS
jgi:hypothetical protein